MWINTACLLPCSISLEQRKALLLENEKLNFLLENKLLHTLPMTLLLLVYYCIMYLTSETQQNEEIKDEVNVQPHAMKGTSCIILCVYLTGIYRR